MKFDQVLELPGNIKIFCNKLNWVLQVGGVNSRSYFPSLDDLCDELLEIRLRMKALKARKVKKDVRLIIKAVRDAREATRKDIDLIKNRLIEADVVRRAGLLMKG